jgi:DNA-binding NtrC family response regulator
MTLTRRISRDGGKDKGGAFLLVKDGPDKGARVKISVSLVIGSEAGCGLTLADPTVSRSHAEVSRTAEGYLLQDLGSTNGTFLNGVRVDRAYLREGAVLTMGQTELEFGPDSQSKPARDPGPSVFGEMVAVSDSMQRVFALLEGLAASDVTVLLEGETGTGKELAARAIHERSPRAGRPYVVFDCSTVPSEIMESELFGHVKGAFTGAAESRRGAVEDAKGGTLFLDEIGELPLNLQPKLLRLMDRKEFRRLGTTETVSADLRFVTATNRDLATLVKQDKFRKDLLYRVSAARVVMPPLRERPEDIPVLGSHFTGQIKPQGPGTVTIGPDAMKALKNHHWPGNVREMKNILETAAALCKTKTISADDLARLFVEMDHTRAGSLKTAEAGAIRKALEKAGGNRRKAARQLGIAPSTLYAKMKKYGLE